MPCHLLCLQLKVHFYFKLNINSIWLLYKSNPILLLCLIAVPSNTAITDRLIRNLRCSTSCHLLCLKQWKFSSIYWRLLSTSCGPRDLLTPTHQISVKMLTVFHSFKAFGKFFKAWFLPILTLIMIDRYWINMRKVA